MGELGLARRACRSDGLPNRRVPPGGRLDAATIARAHAEGLRVLSYTINDPERSRQLRNCGLDCVITDAVDLIRPGD